MDISQDKIPERRLLNACEKLKRKLSFQDEGTVDLDNLLPDGQSFSGTMSRETFEALCSSLFQDTARIVENVIEKARLNKSDIDEIVLVGGSTRIPKIKGRYWNRLSLLASFL